VKKALFYHVFREACGGSDGVVRTFYRALFRISGSFLRELARSGSIVGCDKSSPTPPYTALGIDAKRVQREAYGGRGSHALPALPTVPRFFRLFPRSRSRNRTMPKKPVHKSLTSCRDTPNRTENVLFYNSVDRTIGFFRPPSNDIP